MFLGDDAFAIDLFCKWEGAHASSGSSRENAVARDDAFPAHLEHTVISNLDGTEPQEKNNNHCALNMPHSISPESTPVEDSAMPQADAVPIKPEPDTQATDVTMSDAPTPAETNKATVNLEDLFDDEDSDPEFSQSEPQVKAEEEASQPEPMYADSHHTLGQWI